MKITPEGLLKALVNVVLAILGIIAVAFYWFMLMKSGGIL